MADSRSRMLRLRAAAHEARAAIARLNAEMRDVLPIGSKVVVMVSKPWTATVAMHSLPFDGSVNVKPDDLEACKPWKPEDRYGTITLNVDNLELAET